MKKILQKSTVFLLVFALVFSLFGNWNVSAADENGPNITKITLDNKEVSEKTLTSAGGQIEFDVFGTNLSNGIEVKVYEGSTESLEVSKEAANYSGDYIQGFTLSFPANTSNTDRIFTVRAINTKSESNFKEATITVSAKTGGGNEGGEGQDVSISSIHVDKAVLPEDGGTIELSVEGNGLTSDNWEVITKTVIKGTSVTPSQSVSIEIGDYTDLGAKMTVGANNMKNDLEIQIIAKIKGSSGTDGQVTTSITLTGDPKDYYTSGALISSASMTSANTLYITFEEEVSIVDKVKINEQIYIDDYNNKGEGKINLTMDDEVAVQGKSMTVEFSEAPLLSSNSAINIKRGALKVNESLYSRDLTWMISSTPNISKIQLSQNVFGYEGGKVTANLLGTQPDKIALERIEASVNRSGEIGSSSDIEVTLLDGPEVEFVIPPNNTDKTQSYTLSVKVDGVSVYEGTGANRAELSVISVLAKGTDTSERTLSNLTITGNNKLSPEDENKNITVNVEKQLGSLKTELRLFGTNLVSTDTKVRAIDENGVIWPVFDVPE